jgi:hypothetical protein
MRGFQDVYLNSWGASTQLAICSKSPCSIAISSWPYLQDAISISPPLQLSRKLVRTRSEHSWQSAHTLHYVRTHLGTIAERNLISAKLARLCGDSRPHWVQTEKTEIPPWKTNGTIRKCSPRAFQWMVMSVCFDNRKFWVQFLCPTLGDQSHHQSLKNVKNVKNKTFCECQVKKWI